MSGLQNSSTYVKGYLWQLVPVATKLIFPKNDWLTLLNGTVSIAIVCSIKQEVQSCYNSTYFRTGRSSSFVKIFLLAGTGGVCSKENIIFRFARLFIINARQRKKNKVSYKRSRRRTRKRSWDNLEQCFLTTGPRSSTGPWHQLYRTLVLWKQRIYRAAI
jgi:hypothetical protein